MSSFRFLSSLSQFLSIVLLLSVISACGGSGSSETPTQSDEGANDQNLNSPTPGDGGGSLGDEGDGDNNLVCTAQYDPVCAKAPATINCITAPCESHQYSTYGNACTTGWADASITFAGECEGLEERLAFADQPIRIYPPENPPEEGFAVAIIQSSIEGNILTMEVSYSGGCLEHEFYLASSGAFMESIPLQLATVLIDAAEEEDPCDSIVNRVISFDLLPLQEIYRRSYQNTSGEILLQDLGVIYRW